jgi:hypothetical protein
MKIKTLTTPARAALADRVVARLTEADRLLQTATTIHQAKIVADLAVAQKVFAQRQRLADDIVGRAHALRTHALAKLGELLKAMPKAKGAKAGGKKAGPRGSYVAPRDSTPTLAELGLDKKTAAVAQHLAHLPTTVREAIARRETTIAKACKVARQRPPANPIATMEAISAARAHVDAQHQLRVTNPERFAADEIFETLRFAGDELRKLIPSLIPDPRCAGARSAAQWHGLIEETRRQLACLTDWRHALEGGRDQCPQTSAWGASK